MSTKNRKPIDLDMPARSPLASPCILWEAGKDRDGYGMVRFEGRMTGAHRVALQIRLGRRLLPGEVAMHLCDNRACVNADHLKAGTILENNRRAWARRSTLAKRMAAVGKP